MLPPSIPANESERLRALARYDVLDSASEESFDEITAFIAKICGMPIAVVSLLDETRQWFKSHYGLEATQTPRRVSFCGHAILQPQQVMIVPDATQDERFVDNPLVTGAPNIRFYAGTPLVTDDGYALGTLCVIDAAARTMTADQVETLRLAGRMVIRLLEQRRTIKLLETEIAERARVEEHLSFVSAHDCLTSLPNRAEFLSRLQLTFERLKANIGRSFAVCFIDLDHFKRINDTLGHVCGDELLTEIGRRLAHVTRTGDMVARLGGDEFTMLIENMSTPATLPLIAERVAEAIRAPLTIGGTSTNITASIGVVFVDRASHSVTDIIRDADVAMYASKEDGRDRYTIFTPDLRHQFALARTR
jgi:diguanylate cyclase (GGDEF)-like protein